MTKELIELITYACRNKLWRKEWDFEEGAEEELREILNDSKKTDSANLDFLKRSIMPVESYCQIVKKFDTPKECGEYWEKIDDCRKIWVSFSVKTGAGELGMRDTSVFGRTTQYGNLFFIDVDRQSLLYLMTAPWFWHGGRNGGFRSGDFIDFMNRNGGKHWDELLKNPEEEDEDE